MTTFTGNFTQQESIPEDAIERAIEVMRSGRLHRYNVASADEHSETAMLELEFAQYQQQQYCLAVASGGYAMQTAMRAVGVAAGDDVLTDAFTLSPVPGAIAALGANPLFIETNRDLVTDLEHLEAVLKNSDAKVLLLSHMRGHLSDMDALCTLLEKHNVTLIEDCAHTMGASFNGRKSGSFGAVGCFSTQTYKHLNSGEGGFLTTDDAEIMARAVILSGSYMLYERHAASPPAETFDTIKLETPNCSGRMDNLRAAILRPQLTALDQNCKRWNDRYTAVQNILGQHPSIYQPQSHPDAAEVFSSFQFMVDEFDEKQNDGFLQGCMKRGVELKWFGAEEPAAYTSRYQSWQYASSQTLAKTDAVLNRLYDCRLPLTFSVDDCTTIAEIIVDEVNQHR